MPPSTSCQASKASRTLDVLYIVGEDIGKDHASNIKGLLERKKLADPSFNYLMIGDGDKEKVDGSVVDKKLAKSAYRLGAQTLSLIEIHGKAKRERKGVYGQHNAQEIINTLGSYMDMGLGEILKACLLSCQGGAANPIQNMELVSFASKKYSTCTTPHEKAVSAMVNAVKKGGDINKNIFASASQFMKEASETLYIKECDQSGQMREIKVAGLKTGQKTTHDNRQYDFSLPNVKKHLTSNVDAIARGLGNIAQKDVDHEKSSIGDSGIDQYRYAEFIRAAERGNLEKIKAVLDSGIDINRESELLGTALIAAISARTGESVKLLLAKGADPNVKDPTSRGDTPIGLATRRCDANMVRTLLRYGADPNLEGNNRRSPIDFVVKRSIQPSSSLSPEGARDELKNITRALAEYGVFLPPESSINDSTVPAEVKELLSASKKFSGYMDQLMEGKLPLIDQLEGKISQLPDGDRLQPMDWAKVLVSVLQRRYEVSDHPTPRSAIERLTQKINNMPKLLNYIHSDPEAVMMLKKLNTTVLASSNKSSYASSATTDPQVETKKSFSIPSELTDAQYTSKKPPPSKPKQSAASSTMIPVAAQSPSASVAAASAPTIQNDPPAIATSDEEGNQGAKKTLGQKLRSGISGTFKRIRRKGTNG